MLWVSFGGAYGAGNVPINALTVGACVSHAVYISRLSEGSGDQGGYVGSFWSILQARTWGHGLGLMCGRM